MAKPMTAVQVLAAMKLWDVPYKQWPGWTTRGRDPEHGPFSDVHGLVIHHTGSDIGQSDDYLDFLATRGKPGLPGPLCNAATDMDGDLWLIAQGRANHAGEGSSATLNHVINEDYAGFKTELKPGPDNIDGNAAYYGNEVRYDGGQPMTAKQYAAVTRWAAAICHFHGWSALSIIGHREHTGRKPDPGSCPMNKFRTDVAALLKAGPPKATKPPVTPSPPKEDDMPLNDADKKWISDEIQRYAFWTQIYDLMMVDEKAAAQEAYEQEYAARKAAGATDVVAKAAAASKAAAIVQPAIAAMLKAQKEI
ncbi:N-acetylmuramoyl-L-alanine amidase [Kribbella qitaiheensis]|uniref:peptidoglycan recognition protein family protein n=1 Tax=Kribbella qitaiheensis TaxID=1544730 RepID=UPI00361CB744